MKRTILFISLNKHTLVVVFVILLLISVAVASAQPSAFCSGICDLAWSPVEEDLLGAVNESGLWLYKFNDESGPLFFPHENATSLSFDPDGKYVAVTSCPGIKNPTASCNGTLSLFNIEDQSWEQLATYEYGIDNVKFSQDANYMAFKKAEVGKWGIQVIDLMRNKTFSIVDRNLTNLVIDYTFDPQSTYIAISNGSVDMSENFNGISVWSLADQKLQASTKENIFARDLMFTQTEPEISFVESDTQVSIWNYQSGRISSLRSMVDIVPDNLNYLSFSRPSFLLASLLDDWKPGDRMLYVWDFQSGEQVFFIDMPEASFSDLITVSSTGKYIAYTSTINEEKIVDLWEKATGTNSRIAFIEWKGF